MMDEDDQAPARQEALHWLAILNDADTSEDDRRAWAAWLAQGETQQRAWANATMLWSRLDALAPERGPGVIAPPIANDPGPCRLSRRQWMGTAAAAVTGIVAGGGYVATHPELFADYRTGIDTSRTIALADGSTVELARSTALSVSWSPRMRHMTLHAGQALFDARYDPHRPFLVTAGGAVMRTDAALFDVNHLTDSTLVTTIRDEVTVTPPVGGIRLAASQQVRCANGSAAGPTTVDPAFVLAWRDNRLVADGMPLADFVTELSRYRRGRILIMGPRLKALPVTAAVSVTDPDAAIATIAASLRLRVRHYTPWLVTLSPIS
ncbi:MAG: FecR domain-containing protein [Gluconacetobacter liquefaciens]